MNIEIRQLEEHNLSLLGLHLRHFKNGEKGFLQQWKAQEKGEGVQLVAWHNDLPVGCLWIRWEGDHDIPRIKDTHPVAATIKDCPSFMEIEVAEDSRGQGIGTLLIRHAETVAAENGYNRVCMTANHGERPQGLYQRLGYSDPGIGVFHTFGTYKNDDGEDVPWDNGFQVFLMKEL
jgi:GNAT superfamily N-acetyltransferase